MSSSVLTCLKVSVRSMNACLVSYLCLEYLQLVMRQSTLVLVLI